MDGRIYHHWFFPGVGIRNLPVHLKEISISFLNLVVSMAGNGIPEIKEYGQTSFIYSITGITSLFCSP